MYELQVLHFCACTCEGARGDQLPSTSLNATATHAANVVGFVEAALAAWRLAVNAQVAGVELLLDAIPSREETNDLVGRHLLPACRAEVRLLPLLSNCDEDEPDGCEERRRQRAHEDRNCPAKLTCLPHHSRRLRDCRLDAKDCERQS